MRVSVSKIAMKTGVSSSDVTPILVRGNHRWGSTVVHMDVRREGVVA